MMAACIARVPVRIHTFTGLVWPTAKGLKRRIIRTTDRLTCACATHIIAEGQGVRNDLINGNITHKPVEVLGYGNVRGIDLDYWQPVPRKEPTDTQSLRFIFVGRLVPDKGINELIEAFMQLLARYPSSTLTLVGWYEDETPLPEQTLRAIRQTPAIRFVGRHDDVRPFYQDADCLVFPSYREGFPNVVLEAGAMCLSAVVTDINGSREIITSGHNGLIVPPHDSEKLLQAMLFMVDNPDARLRMARCARELIESHFDQQFVRKCQINYYKRIF
jgi:glycosyltransferase involved in cell wall biosynthesis